MSEQRDLIEAFYQAFQKRDHRRMGEAYHPDAQFRDEAFELKGEAIGAMWQMLCERGKDLSLTYRVDENSGRVTAHWEATYTFSQTGRKVHNMIDAEFNFADGRIICHVDTFDFWRWSRQALGLPGLLLGWTPLLKRKVQAGAADNLKEFMKNRQGTD